MTVLSVPIAVSKPRDHSVPPALVGYSIAAHAQRDIPVCNGLAFRTSHEESDDEGDDDEIVINILSHDKFPSIEIGIRGTSSHFAKKVEQCAKLARGTAVEKALGLDTKPPVDKAGKAKTTTKEKATKRREKQRVNICQVSTNVNETLEMITQQMSGKRLNAQQLQELAVVLSKHHKAFAKDSKDYGKVTDKYGCTHQIITGDAKAVHQKPYRHSKFEEDFLKAMTEELLEAGLIRHSSSDWISPVVLVKKKDGGLRMCIDFRRLNAVTKRDPYQLPRMDTLMDRMQGCDFFTSIDVLSAFWNVPMAEEDIMKTGFTTMHGNYEWLRMPFGLINASSTFQRLMDAVTSGLQSTAAYIDDVFVFTKTWAEHLLELDKTLGRLVEAGLKCKLSKCQFGGDSVKCLGQVVSKQGVTIDEDKLQAIRDLPRPKDVPGLRSFIGFINYFRHFMRDYAAVSVPLLHLIKKGVEWNWTEDCEAAFQTLKQKLCERPVLAMPDFDAGHHTFRLHTDWSKVAIGAVLLQESRNPEPTEEGTDAKREHAIAYASRVLNSAERNYAPTEGECLAIVWAVKKFRHYLHGRPFEILTDHHALQWLQVARFTNSKLERWALAMQEHDYTIIYHKGELNVIADCLSRNVAAALVQWDTYSPSVKLLAMEAYPDESGVDLDELTKAEHDDCIRCVLCNDPGGGNNMAFCEACNRPYHLRCHLPPMATVPTGEWRCLSCRSQGGQLEELHDPDTLLWLHDQDFYKNEELMLHLRNESRGMPPDGARRSLRRLLKRVRMHPLYDGWIQVSTKLHGHQDPDHLWRTSPPLAYRAGVIRMYHDMLAHAGIEHTYKVMTKQVHWINMKQDVAAFIYACLVCQQRKAVMYEPMHREQTIIHGPLKHIHVDLAGPFKVAAFENKAVTFDASISVAKTRKAKPKAIEAPEPQPEEEENIQPKQPAKNSKRSSKKQSKPDTPIAIKTHWVLLIIDYFTKAAELLAIPTKAAEHIARTVYDHWFCRYGIPTYVTSDNGTEFQGDFAGMLERLGIEHITTAVRHPQSNGVCERLVGTFKRKLYSYCDGHPNEWISYLPRIRYAYMQEVHSTTRYSPFELVYGFTPSHPLPVKINLLDAQNPGEKSYLDLVMNREVVDADLCRFVEDLRHRHLRLDQEVKEAILEAQGKDMERFLQRKMAFHDSLPTAQVGDYVFEVRETPRPMRNIADGPFLVVRRSKDLALLRTGVTMWDPVPKEFTRKVDFLTPCLTKRQALAKAYDLPIETATREAPLKCLLPCMLLELSFEPCIGISPAS